MTGNLIRIAICTVIMLITVTIGYFIRYKRNNRYLQCVFPVIAFIYSIFAVLFVCFRLDKISNSFSGSNILDTFGDATIIIINILSCLLYYVVKVFFLIINRLFQRDRVFPKSVIERYYYRHEKYGVWLLRDKWRSIRDVLHVLVWTFSAFCGVLFGILLILSESDYYWKVMIFPAFMALVFIECYQFLSGYTEFEYLRVIGGDKSYSSKIRNYYKMRGIYSKLFPHEILVSGTASDYSSVSNVKDLLEKLRSSDSEYERRVSKFFRMNGSIDSYDVDSIIATLRMLEGKNIVFFNPFYRDLSRYIILPMINTLLSNKKCLFVVGRNSAKQDVADWLKDILYEFGHIESLWRVKELNHSNPECEVGIMGFTSIYDSDIVDANKPFFSEVGFVFVLEASLIVNTGQIGLSILSGMIEENNPNAVYCIADRIADGLVDTVSHVFQKEFLEVAAPPISKNLHSYIGWKAEGDYLRQKLFEKQTKYLGNGIELAAAAIKNQVPKVSWFGETKSPLLDIKWVAGQYFATICKYMNIPVEQDRLYERIKFIPNVWSVPEENEQFVIAEDEFTNMFATVRTFLSRGKHQTFINVLSENYLLRDYMRCNSQMFISNPNAIPSIVPDYAKTERNTLIKLLLMMREREVSEEEVIREFGLVGIHDDDGTKLLTKYLKKYMGIDNSLLHIRMERTHIQNGYSEEISFYSIYPERFDEVFGRTIRNAYYICEDEKEKEYIDAKLFGNITQTLMEGYFLSYDGKYYRVELVTAENGVILRRASNLYDSRRYYRQIRKYRFDEWQDEDIVSIKSVMDIEIAKIEADFSVETTGFLDMDSTENLRTARVHDLSKDPRVGEYTRKYHKKTILRIKLPDTTDRIRFTICILLQEVFRSVFPDAWHYIAALSVIPDDVDGMLNYLIYELEGDAEKEYLYIVEDSELDLGLLGAVENNLKMFMELITDFLNWHYQKMREPAFSDPKVITPEFPEVNYKKISAFSKMMKRIGLIFGGKKEKDVVIPSTEVAEKTVVRDNNPSEMTIKVNSEGEIISEDSEDIQSVDSKNNLETVNRKIAEKRQKYPYDETLEPELNEVPDIVSIDGTDIFDEDGTIEDNEYFDDCFRETGVISTDKSRYQNECYLKFGFDEVDDRLKLEEVIKYLTLRGFSINSFRKARERDAIENTIIDNESDLKCDFCDTPISGVSYERLNDGRIRCNDCSATAINNLQEFRDIFLQCLNLMESFFDIDFDVEITVKMTDAYKIARGFGSVYQPTCEADSRVLGYAQRLFGKYSIYMENGSPRMETISTIVHELTHIWQYRNWDENLINKYYPTPEKRDMVYEGMAVWVSIQYLYLIGEYAYARKVEAIYSAKKRDDLYAEGFKMYAIKYPLVKESELLVYSPFKESMKEESKSKPL